MRLATRPPPCEDRRLRRPWLAAAALAWLAAACGHSESASRLAGTPGEDPDVARLRAAFAAAPVATTLPPAVLLGGATPAHPLRCEVRDATLGASSVETALLQLATASDGTYRNRGDGFSRLVAPTAMAGASGLIGYAAPLGGAPLAELEYFRGDAAGYYVERVLAPTTASLPDDVRRQFELARQSHAVAVADASGVATAYARCAVDTDEDLFPLDRDHHVVLASGSTVGDSDDWGEYRQGELRAPLELGGATYAPNAIAVSFAAGLVVSGTLAKPATIDGRTYAEGHLLERYESGTVQRGTLAQPAMLGGLALPPGRELAFDRRGYPRNFQGDLQATTTLGGVALPAGSVLSFGPQGAASLAARLGAATTLGGVTLAAGTSVAFAPDWPRLRPASATVPAGQQLYDLALTVPADLTFDANGLTRVATARDGQVVDGMALAAGLGFDRRGSRLAPTAGRLVAATPLAPFGVTFPAQTAVAFGDDGKLARVTLVASLAVGPWTLAPGAALVADGGRFASIVLPAATRFGAFTFDGVLAVDGAPPAVWARAGHLAGPQANPQRPLMRVAGDVRLDEQGRLVQASLADDKYNQVYTAAYAVDFENTAPVRLDPTTGMIVEGSLAAPADVQLAPAGPDGAVPYCRFQERVRIEPTGLLACGGVVGTCTTPNVTFTNPCAGGAACAESYFDAAGRRCAVDPPPPPPAPEWARRVVGFSSQYGTTEWSAEQVLGAPDTMAYGDRGTAWTTQSANGGPGYIQVEFARRDLPARGLVVRETYGNGFVTHVAAIDPDGTAHDVWSGTDPSAAGVPVDFRIEWPTTAYRVVGVRVDIDTNRTMGFEEIDALQILR
jgi:hypothetical protein